MSAQKLITEHIDLWTSVVKAKNTQGRGSSKKRELYGIKKLRELILELAVRGKLVPQDPTDEPASELLKRISAEKERLIKDKKIKKPKKLPDIENGEKIGFLPSGWEFVRLNDLGEWGAGATPRRGASELYGGNIPWFKSGELVGDYISESEETVTELALKKSSLRFNKAGDVLLAMYGATIGKTSILSVPATTNQAVCACTPFSGFSNIFLLTVLKAYKARFIGMGAGGAQPNISREKIIATVIALPPEPEQPRIVAKVDELMALCDQLEQQTESSLDAHNLLVDTLLSTLTDACDANGLSDSWARLADHFDTLLTTDYAVEQLKQTILQLAVQGKLVPQDPADEPASELLKRIAAEQNRLVEQENLKTKANHIIADEDQWLSVPLSWTHLRLGNFAKFIDYRGKTPTKMSQGVRLITAKNVRFGYISLEPEEFISEEEYVSWMTRGFPKVGDLLFTPEAPLGNVAIIDFEEKFALAQRAICFQLHENKCAGFLRIIIMSKPFQEQLILNATGMTATGIKASKLKEIAIPIPPLEEQHRIVSKVDNLMAFCDQLKAQLKDVQATQLHLSDAVVENALTA